MGYGSTEVKYYTFYYNGLSILKTLIITLLCTLRKFQHKVYNTIWVVQSIIIIIINRYFNKREWINGCLSFKRLSTLCDSRLGVRK